MRNLVASSSIKYPANAFYKQVVKSIYASLDMRKVMKKETSQYVKLILNESTETEEKDSHVESFPLTSTPKKQEFKCKCDTCFVDQYIQNRHKAPSEFFQE